MTWNPNKKNLGVRNIIFPRHPKTSGFHVRCMQLVQSALSWFEEANIHHTAVTSGAPRKVETCHSFTTWKRKKLWDLNN